MSQILGANGQPVASAAAQQAMPLMGEALEVFLTKMTADHQWIVDALTKWVKKEIALTEAATGQAASYTLILAPLVIELPYGEPGAIALKRVMPLNLQMIDKAAAESALGRRPSFMRQAQGFLEVSQGEDLQPTAVIGFFTHSVIRVEENVDRVLVSA